MAARLPSTSEFRKTIWRHYNLHGRTMTWRKTTDPYRILISEIMLQQTQVARVEKFYKNFIRQFPNFKVLARAKTSDILRAWQGLGYNRRAIALQKCAQVVIKQHNGKLPRDPESLIALPGIGAYTAGAVRAFAFNQPDIFIETNIRRVFIHYFFSDRGKVTDAQLQRYIERTVDRKRPRDWYYALMDYGAMLGESARRKTNYENPNRRSAHYTKQSAFLGSDREIRSKILKELLGNDKILSSKLSRTFKISPAKFSKIANALSKEGFIVKQGKYLSLKND